MTYEEKMKLIGLCPNQSPCGETGYLLCVKQEVGQYILSTNVYEEIKTERKAQDEQWGGPSHDDKHSDHDWIAYLSRHIGKAVMWPFDPLLFRRQMVKIAALAVAAIEWIDRVKIKKGKESDVSN